MCDQAEQDYSDLAVVEGDTGRLAGLDAVISYWEGRACGGEEGAVRAYISLMRLRADLERQGTIKGIMAHVEELERALHNNGIYE